MDTAGPSGTALVRYPLSPAAECQLPAFAKWSSVARYLRTSEDPDTTKVAMLLCGFAVDSSVAIQLADGRGVEVL